MVAKEVKGERNFIEIDKYGSNYSEMYDDHLKRNEI
jgi:hypothetical protein